MEDARHQKNAAATAPLSGDERHVTTPFTEVPAEVTNPSTMWKGKARSLSPHQFTQRETFLSPKQHKSAVIDRNDYVFPNTEEDVPLGRRSSSTRARTSEEWTLTDDSNDPNGRQKLRKRVDPASKNPDRYHFSGESFWQRRDPLAAKMPKPTQSVMEMLRPSLAKPHVRNTSIQFEEDANISSAYKSIFNPHRRDGETSDEYNARKNASQRIKRESTPAVEQVEDKRSSPTRHKEVRVLQARVAELQERVEAVAETRRKYDAKVGRRWSAEKAARDELKAAKNQLAEVASRPATVENSVCSPPREGYKIPRANEEYIKNMYSPEQYEAWVTAEAILDHYRELDLKEFGRSNIPPSANRQGYEGTQRERLPKEESNHPNERDSGGRPPRPPSPPSSDDDGDSSKKGGGGGRGGPGRSPPHSPDKGQDDNSDSEDSAERGGHRPPPQPPKTILRSTSEYHRSALRKSKSRSMSLAPIDPLWAEDGHEMVYENAIVQKIRDTIYDRVGTEVAYNIAGMKNIKPVPPEKYGGEDDIESFENWLAGVLRWLRVAGVTGESKEQLQVDLCGTTLKGLAADWFHLEVESFDRKVRDWTFTELVVAMYGRFIHEVTAQNATTKFYNAKYSKSKGVLAFYNDLE